MNDERKPLKLSEFSGNRDDRGLICKECRCRDFRVLHTRRADGYILQGASAVIAARWSDSRRIW